MSYAKKHTEFQIDRTAWVLIGLMAAFQICALYLTSQLSGLEMPEQRTNAGFTGFIVAVAAVEITLLIVCWRLYKRLSERWRQLIKKVAIYSLLTVVYTVGLLLYWLQGLAWLYVILVPVLWGLYKYIDPSGYTWIAFNMIAFVAGVIASILFGVQLAPKIVIPLMVILMVYDYLAVDLTDIMGDLIEFSASTGIPNYFVIPNQLRVDLERLKDFLSGKCDDKPPDVATIIGLGDFLFPTVLATSVLVQADFQITAAVVGVVLGSIVAIPVLRAATLRRDGATPALPWLNTGAIGGYAVGILITLL